MEQFIDELSDNKNCSEAPENEQTYLLIIGSLGSEVETPEG